jgi:hypothetical protein
MDAIKHAHRIFKDENGNVISHRNFEVEEQDIASQYINKDDKVLELGARYGTVSAIILDKISDTKNCVIVDPDTNITESLVNNLRRCGYDDARVFVGTVGASKQKIHSNDSYATYTESCEGDECKIENMTYDAIQAKYDIVFNTIVADCEGCLPGLIEHIDDNLGDINKIIFETDRSGNVDYEKVYSKLNNCGFKNVKEGFVQIWVR